MTSTFAFLVQKIQMNLLFIDLRYELYEIVPKEVYIKFRFTLNDFEKNSHLFIEIGIKLFRLVIYT